MGKAIGLLFFFVCFIIFAIVKSAATGVKAAYHAVFNPNQLTPEQEVLLVTIITIIAENLNKSYTPIRRNLTETLLITIPQVQDFLAAKGYPSPDSTIRDLVIQLIPRTHVYVPPDQISETIESLNAAT